MTQPTVRKTIIIPAPLYQQMQELGETNCNAYVLRLIQQDVANRQGKGESISS
jgi:hypothetical protein